MNNKIKMIGKFSEKYFTFLENRKELNRYRKLNHANDYSKDKDKDKDKKFIDFSTNDYLCLSKDKDILNKALKDFKKNGIGSTGSRLLSGNNDIFSKFEKRIAKDKKEETSLIFSSGFLTNYTVLSALLDNSVLKDTPICFCDKYNHASIYQALLNNKLILVRYKNNDMNHLEKLLNKYRSYPNPKFIISETIFGMHGNILDINTITKLSELHGAFLYLDEAHATGIIGKNGYGLSTTVNLKNTEHLIMGTFSKALGTSGGYVACNKIIKSYLVNNAKGFIYSTAPSPLIINYTYYAWKKIKFYEEKRKYLNSISSYLRDKLIELNYNVGVSNSHIIPIILNDENTCMEYKNKLLKNNIIVSCVRPPSVPLNQSLIRISLNIKHTKIDIDKFLNILEYR